jgi:cell division protein FtsL
MVTDFSKKGNKEFFNKKLLFRTFGILFFVVILVLIIADFKIYLKKAELKSQIADYQRQIEEIKKNNQDLKEQIANADNTDYLEKIAYEQLGQQKPGEKQVIFVEPPQKTETVLDQQNFWNVNKWTGWFGGFWQWIKSKF